MSKDKQIEEMAKTVCHLDRTCDQCMTSFECKAMTYAKRFYHAGYRKASEVALEVIGEVVSKAKAIFCPDCDYDVADIRYNLDWLEAELKKKYTEGEE